MQLAIANPIRYRGYYYGQDTGLYYLNARYYSPELRRFISPDDTAYLDPENANGLNLYAYCYNDPVNYADTIIDIGITTTHRGMGWYYGIERFIIAQWKYKNIWKLPMNLLTRGFVNGRNH